jgi:hypothetical protein
VIDEGKILIAVNVHTMQSFVVFIAMFVSFLLMLMYMLNRTGWFRGRYSERYTQPRRYTIREESRVPSELGD